MLTKNFELSLLKKLSNLVTDVMSLTGAALLKKLVLNLSFKPNGKFWSNNDKQTSSVRKYCW